MNACRAMKVMLWYGPVFMYHTSVANAWEEKNGGKDTSTTLVLGISFLHRGPNAVALAERLHRELAVRQQCVQLLEELLGAAQGWRPCQQYRPPCTLQQWHRLLGSLSLQEQDMEFSEFAGYITSDVRRALSAAIPRACCIMDAYWRN